MRNRNVGLFVVPQILLAALLFPAAAVLSAEAPVGKLSYQGRLTNASGNPLTGSFDLTFKICDSAAGACAAPPNLLWSETQNSVTVDRGIVSVDLGANTPIPLNVLGGATTYLEIAVDVDPAMAPRIRLLTSPYAVNSYSLAGYPFTALVSTFSAQTVGGDKTFAGIIGVSSLSVVGTITSTSTLTAGNASLKTVQVSSLTSVGTITSTSGFTGGNGSFYLLNASTASVIGTVTSTSGFVGIGSTLTLLNASNLALGTVPNERIDTSSVAKWNASGQIDNFRLDPSSVTLFGPVRSRSIIGTWTSVNLAANLTDSQLVMSGHNAAVTAIAATSRMKMPFAGIVRGVIVAGSAACTQGTAIFQVFKNGADIGAGPDATIDNNAASNQYVGSSGGAQTFAAGDILDIRVTSSSNFLPNGSAEYFAQIVVEWTN